MGNMVKHGQKGENDMRKREDFWTVYDYRLRIGGI